jgi:hypothetical protein
MWLVRKIHTYAGLLTFVNLVVYGIVGLSASYLLRPHRPAAVVTYRNFTVPPNLTDLQVAEKVCAELGLTLATPVHSFVISHNEANELVLDLRHANGGHLVTVLEKEGRLKVEERRNSMPLYLYTLHETTAALKSGDWRMQFWADYNEFAMWSLFLMLGSGMVMFPGFKARGRLALLSLAAGFCAFAALYWWSK